MKSCTAQMHQIRSDQARQARPRRGRSRDRRQGRGAGATLGASRLFRASSGRNASPPTSQISQGRRGPPRNFHPVTPDMTEPSRRIDQSLHLKLLLFAQGSKKRRKSQKKKWLSASSNAGICTQAASTSSASGFVALNDCVTYSLPWEGSGLNYYPTSELEGTAIILA